MIRPPSMPNPTVKDCGKGRPRGHHDAHLWHGIENRNNVVRHDARGLLSIVEEEEHLGAKTPEVRQALAESGHDALTLVKLADILAQAIEQPRGCIV